MKITFIVPTLDVSGGLRVVSIYARLLSEKGHIVTVVAPKDKVPSFKQRIKHTFKWKGYQYKSHFNTEYFNNVNYNVVVTNKVESVLAKDVPDADVVIATWWLTAEWINKLPKPKGEKVYFIQGYETYEHLQKERVKKTYRLPFYKITIAKWLVSIMQHEYNDDNVKLVPNSVEQELFHTDKRAKQIRPTVGFLFSDNELKGVTDALKVIDNLKGKIPNLRVIAFGAHTPDRIKLPEYIELSINPKQDNIRLLYQQCDLWLCCSLIEGFGLTILEAMACRTPCVSTKCGGPEDIITENENGFLCDVADIAMLTELSYKVLSFDASTWSDFSSQAQESANAYSWDDATNLFEEALFGTIRKI